MSNLFASSSNLLKMAIDLNLQFRAHSTLRKEVELSFYLRNRCSVSFDLGQRTGKTTHIIEAAKASDVLVVCFNKLEMEMLENQGVHNCVFYSTDANVMRQAASGSYRTVYIEQGLFYTTLGYSLIPIYDAFGYDAETQTFVILG
jgi:hypothetical protein